MIESAVNPKLKHLKKLLTSRKYRYQHQSYVIETQHVLDEVIQYTPHHLEQLFLRDTTPEAPYQSLKAPIFKVKAPLFDAMASINGATVLAIVRMNEQSLPSSIQTMIYCDGIQIPANLGAIIRNMVAFNCDALVLSPESCDPYHPESVRAAAGSLIHLPIDTLSFNTLCTRYPDFMYYALDANQGKPIYEHSFLPSTIIIIGAEKGLSQTIRNHIPSKRYLRIPISEHADSLNVAVSVGIVLFALQNQSEACL